MRMEKPALFRSFLQGGFESSCHRRRGDGRRIDVIAASGHDAAALEDYRLLRQCGLQTARDGLRWHLIEKERGLYDWSSFLPMLRAARQAGVQVIWDLCHYGVPGWLDIWSAEFVPRFAAFAAAAAGLICEESGDDGTPRVYSVMNEISFWAWFGGERGYAYPFSISRGAEFKRRLVKAAIAAIEAVRAVDPRAHFMQPEPAIHVVADRGRPDLGEQARLFHDTQFEAFDMLRGTLNPELGGREEMLDIVGVNFYWNNQWAVDGRPADSETQATLPFGHPDHRPLSSILADIHQRYRRPILISETGAEGNCGPAWISYVASEARQAMRAGVPVLGICLYPIMDYPGWTNDRHCSCGLIELAEDWRERRTRPEMADRLEEEDQACRAALMLLHP